MNNQTFDRYAKEPSRSWIGHLWISTRKDAEGFYLRGRVLDVAPGKLLVRWLLPQRPAEEWISLDSGTFKRSPVRDFLDAAPWPGGEFG